MYTGCLKFVARLSKLRRNHNNGECTYIDFLKAFCKIDYVILLKKLRSFGFSTGNYQLLISSSFRKWFVYKSRINLATSAHGLNLGTRIKDLRDSINLEIQINSLQAWRNRNRLVCLEFWDSTSAKSGFNEHSFHSVGIISMPIHFFWEIGSNYWEPRSSGYGFIRYSFMGRELTCLVHLFTYQNVWEFYWLMFKLLSCLLQQTLVVKL